MSENTKIECNTCIYPEDGMCTECAGDNYGHQTEIDGTGFCENYKRKVGE